MPRNEHDATLKAFGVPRATRRALRRKRYPLHKAVMRPRSILDVLTYEAKDATQRS